MSPMTSVEGGLLFANNFHDAENYVVCALWVFSGSWMSFVDRSGIFSCRQLWFPASTARPSGFLRATPRVEQSTPFTNAAGPAAPSCKTSTGRATGRKREEIRQIRLGHARQGQVRRHCLAFPCALRLLALASNFQKRHRPQPFQLGMQCNDDTPDC